MTHAQTSKTEAGPRALSVGLTHEQKAERRLYLGGSDANTIMSGDDDRIKNLWLEKRGERDPDDLDNILPVVMGQYTEGLNLYWYERMTGRLVVDEGKRVIHPTYGFMSCTLDGMTITESGDLAIFEAKHVNAFSKIEDVVQRYMPQLHHNMACTGTSKAILSVFKGTLEYEVFEVEEDFMYLSQLVDAERSFWACVESGESPVAVQIEAPAVLRKTTVDMTGNNQWASCAADYLEHEESAKKFDEAKKAIKPLIPEDAKIAFGHGISASVAKNGAVKITKEEVTNV